MATQRGPGRTVRTESCSTRGTLGPGLNTRERRSWRRAGCRFVGLIVGALLTIGCCLVPATEADEAPDAAPPLPTADPYARGYTDDDFPRIRELAPDVYSYEQLRSAGNERFTTVSFFVVTEKGVLVADGQGSVEETARLVDAIARITDQAITHVLICSDHGDHTAGNSAFPADAEFLAHPTSALALRRRAQSDPTVVMPTRLVHDRTVLDLGGTRIVVRFLGRAHTGGDLIVHLPKERVVFMSEAYLHRVFPAMRSAFPTEWIDMIEAAQALDANIYVPGHGFVDDAATLRRELEVYQQALQTVVDEGRRLHALGLSLDEAQVQADFGELGAWSLSAGQAPRALQRVYLQLDGELPAPESGR